MSRRLCKPVADRPDFDLAADWGVSRETLGKLVLYNDLLLKWQARVNLISPDTIANVWQRHFVDSLQLIKLLKKKDMVIVDMGTGAGFPGMAIAIVGFSRVHLIESDTKKTTFLREVARQTNTHVVIHNSRVEEVLLDTVDVILSRALAPLDVLFGYAQNFVSHETICLFHKGKNYTNDIEDARKSWDFQHVVFPSVTDSLGVILKITDLRKRGV